MKLSSTQIGAMAAMVVAMVIGAAIVLQPRDITAEGIRSALQKNPDLLVEAITANRKAIFNIVNQTGVEEQARLQKEAAAAEAKAYEDTFKNPLKPLIDGKALVRGESGDVRYTLVEYADFQCPYCAGAVATVDALRQKYGKDLRFVYKNLPLPFHDQAMPAAQWLEAIAIQSPEKAWKFHDILFRNQDKLSVAFFRATARSLGVDVDKCERDAKSQSVRDRIGADMEEARRFGFDGTPGFLLNGVPVKGAYPIDHFEAIVKKLSAIKT